MPEYALIKTLHILGAIVLFGLGLGSVFYKYMSDRSGNVSAMAVTNRLVVRADAWFTTPAILLQPLTGFYLVAAGGYDWAQGWLRLAVLLYLLAGACWLPVLVLQVRMRDEAAAAALHGRPLSPRYWRHARYWRLLGLPAFGAMLLLVWLMVSRPV